MARWQPMKHPMRKLIPWIWIAALVGFQKWFATSTLCEWQSRVLHWNYAFHALFFVPPLAGLIHSRRSIAAYGLSREHMWSSARVGLLFAVPLILMPLVTQLAVHQSLPLRRVVEGRVLQTLFYKLVMVGLAEELLFRGYFYGELRSAFTRYHRFFGIQVNAAFWITAALFTLLHFTQPRTPWEWIYIPLASVLFGWLRVRTSSLAAPVLLHFGLHVHRTLFGMGAAACVATGVAWFLAFFFLPRALAETEAEQPPARDG